MATPLSPFINARICYCASGGLSGPESGFKQLPGQSYLITAFLKNKSERYRSSFSGNVDLALTTDFFEGYIVGFNPISHQEDFETHDFSSDADYDDSGKRPPGFRGPSEIQVKVGTNATALGQLLNAEGKFDDLGIGAIIRDVIGDRLVIKIERS